MDNLNGMRAIVKRNPSPGIHHEEVRRPESGLKEIVVKVRGAGVCGTDLHIYDWDKSINGRMILPRVIGHEITGEIVEVGEGVTRLKKGDLISAESHIVCGTCSLCRRGEAHLCKNTKILGIDVDGGFAEYVKIPEENAWKIPLSPFDKGGNKGGFPLEVSAVLEPFGNAVHAVLIEEIRGKSIAVFGCGPIGLFAIGIAKASGASSIFAIETRNYRLNLAETMGASRVYDPRKWDVIREILRETEGEGVDVILEMSGHPDAIHQGLKILTPGGRFTAFGLPNQFIHLNLSEEIIFKGIRIFGIIGRRLPETWNTTFDLLTGGSEGSPVLDIRPIITHTYSMREFDQAIQLIKSGESGKVILIP